jgi:catechol 2,3-dioxygenase-like lactoylglutathione lyase family enzyme
MDRSISFYTSKLGLHLTNRREIKRNNAEIAFLKDDDENAIELTRRLLKETISIT